MNHHRETLEALAMECFELVTCNDTITADDPPPQWWLDRKWKLEDDEAAERAALRRRERVESLKRFYERELKKDPHERVGL